MSLKKVFLRLTLILLLFVLIDKERMLYNLWLSAKTTQQQQGEFLTYRHYLDFVQTHFKEKLPPNKLSKQGYWLWWQRVSFMEGGFLATFQQNAFEQAALTNTQQMAHDHYHKLPERQAYYRWANDYFNRKGTPVKWMNAADRTVGNLSMALLPPAKWLGYANEEIQQFIIEGNKLILDDMMPRIKDLTLYEDFTKMDALKWDAQLLADEQTLIQPLYEQLSPKSIRLLESNIRRLYGVNVNLLSIEKRWAFGTHLMGYMGVLPDMMPVAKGDWKTVSIKIKTHEQ